MNGVRLPFSRWWPVFAGALVGVALRLAFALGLSPMSASFIYLVPLLVGSITVYVAERTERCSWSYYAGAGAVANALFVTGTLVILVEGVICAILIVPLMMLEGAVGGLAMGAACRLANIPRSALCSLAVLPIALGLAERDLPLPDRVRVVQRHVTIDAAPERIWREIHHADAIRAAEVERGWAYRIGVPVPIAGITEMTPEGRVRHVRMGKGIHFDQVVVDWKEPRHVRFTYRFGEDSVPAGALDDHVRIGGQYFDLVDTSYTLTPRGRSTELAIAITYRVSTRFNWYAQPIADALLGNFGDTILALYRSRSSGA